MNSSACSFQIFSLAKSAWKRDPFSCSCMPGPVDKVMRVAGTALLAIADCFLLLVEFACSAIGLSSEISKFENAIKSLEEKSLDMEKFDSLFQDLLTSPLIDKDREAWTGLIDRLVRKLEVSEIEKLAANQEIPYEKKNNGLVLQNTHKHLADQIKLSPQLISKFCNYFESKYLNKYLPCFFYIIFKVYREEFSSQKEIQSEIDAACKKNLSDQAIDRFPNDGNATINIDPRIWFGPITESNNEIPELLKDVLWERIQYLHTSKGLKTVSMFGRMETQLPYNFTLPLAKLITDAEIMLDHNGTIDPAQLSKPQFAPTRSGWR